jgi:anti-sigma factor RsiW
MKCISEKLLQEYLDGEVPENKRGQVELHLSRCAVCRRKAASLRASRDFVVDRLRLLDTAEIPSTPPLDLAEAQSKQPQGPFFRWFFGLRIRMPLAAAAAVGMFLAGLLLGSIRYRQKAVLSDSSSHEGSSVLYVASSNAIMALPFELNLAKYRPLDQPRLIITQEELR